jgi:hypothetical protein
MASSELLVISDSDPFSGRWRFDPAQSELTVRGPRSWVLEILAGANKLSVCEEIESWDGQRSRVTVDAIPDGRDYPVFGSAIVDAIAYKRLDANLISSLGRKRGVPSLEQKIELSRNGSTLTVTFTIFRGRKEMAAGTAVFKKSRP